MSCEKGMSDKVEVPILSATAMQRPVLVTGASGFVGQHLVARLRRLSTFGKTICCLGRPQFDVIGRDIKVFDTDIRNSLEIDDLIAAMHPSQVFHLAAVAASSDANSDERRAWEINLMGTANIVQSLRRHARDAVFIHVSSSEAYGRSFNDNRLPLDENSPLNPVTVYGATKAAADLLIGQASYDGFSAVRMRPFNHTGPGQRQNFVIPDFAMQIVRIERDLQEPIIKTGNLEAERDFLDVRDVVQAYVAAAHHAAILPQGTVINVSTGKPWKIGKVLDEMLKQSSVTIAVQQDPLRMRANEIPVASGNPSLAEKLLGWAPTIGLEKTIADVLEYWRNAPANYLTQTRI